MCLPTAIPATGWSLTWDHELNTGRGKVLQRGVVTASVTFMVLLASSLHSWFCICVTVGCLGAEGYEKSGIR